MIQRKGHFSSIMERHRQAMKLAEEADELKMKGRRTTAHDRYREAFEIERSLLSEPTFEPSHSILIESAASLGFECGRFMETCQLVSKYAGTCGVGEIRARVEAIGEESSKRLAMIEDIEFALRAAMEHLPHELRSHLIEIYSLETAFPGVETNPHSFQPETEKTARVALANQLGHFLDKSIVDSSVAGRIRLILQGTI